MIEQLLKYVLCPASFGKGHKVEQIPLTESTGLTKQFRFRYWIRNGT